MDYVDLSPLSGIPPRNFKVEVRLGRERGRVEVFLKPHLNRWGILIVRYDHDRPWISRRSYRLKKVPASLDPRLVRVRASEPYRLRLEAGYAKILSSVRPMSHDQLHTDVSGYDD